MAAFSLQIDFKICALILVGVRACVCVCAHALCSFISVEPHSCGLFCFRFIFSAFYNDDAFSFSIEMKLIVPVKRSETLVQNEASLNDDGAGTINIYIYTHIYAKQEHIDAAAHTTHTIVCVSMYNMWRQKIAWLFIISLPVGVGVVVLFQKRPAYQFRLAFDSFML